MKTYTYKITKGKQVFTQTIEDKNRKAADEQIVDLIGEKTQHVFVDSRDGTLEDYLSPETMARLYGKKRILREQQKPRDSRNYGPKDNVQPGATRPRS